MAQQLTKKQLKKKIKFHQKKVKFYKKEINTLNDKKTRIGFIHYD